MKFVFPIIASVFLITICNTAKSDDLYQQCITNVQKDFIECKQRNSSDSPQADDCDSQKISAQEACKTLLPDSQQDDLEWTSDDDEILGAYPITKEGFLANVSTYSECTAKIQEIDRKIKAINMVGNEMPDDIKNTLTKICKTEFSKDKTG